MVFTKAEDLQRLYPLFVHHGMTTFRSPDVLRFLGKKLTAKGKINGNVEGEVTSDLKQRQEGVRIKHRYGGNSVKLYDKAYTPDGSVLRAELTMQNPQGSGARVESALRSSALPKEIRMAHCLGKGCEKG